MYQAFQVSTTFGVNAPPNMSVEGFADAANPHIPSRKDYLFRRDHLRDVLAFLSAPKGDGLYITGPTGSGKTSLVEQVATRINCKGSTLPYVILKNKLASSGFCARMNHGNNRTLEKPH